MCHDVEGGILYLPENLSALSGDWTRVTGGSLSLSSLFKPSSTTSRELLDL